MADWKQITARIRRARTGKDPAGQLSSLFEKTRDAMVAFELARFFETSGQAADAAKWYVAAAERFRRADWKSKAQEAAVRLGADISAASAGSSSEAAATETATNEPAPAAVPPTEETEEEADSHTAGAPELESASGADVSGPPADPSEKKRRRRGRRGGRNRRRGETRPDGATTSTAKRAASPGSARSVAAASEEPALPQPHPHAIPSLPVEPAPDFSAASVRGRSGDPGLSSRLSVLEMQLRRLLTCPPVKLNEADHAPAGPGVLVLTDSDLTSYYFVEACQTLRIAVGNLLRGGASRRGADSIKPRLAEDLGIPESRVAKYLADHCVVRWLQLDEGASHFAHYVIAVLRPSLNE